MEKIKIIIDTDPGIDDAAAILAALHCEELEIALITTVAGNVSAAQTTENALRLLKFAGKRVPVAKGCERPLLAPLRNAAHVHGETGMGGYEFPFLCEDDKPLEQHAVNAMRDEIFRGGGKTTLVPIGPLTNIALLFCLYPECKARVERIVMMCGSAARGNDAPMAEFNALADPEAAKIVFDSGVEIVMCGLDVTNRALLTQADADALRVRNKTGAALWGMFRRYRGGEGAGAGFAMHDACAVAYLVRPDLFTARKTYVDVELRGTLTYGCTVADLEGKLGRPENAAVCLDIDAEGFREWLTDTLKKSV
jgi:non-specific riboncleoside hydrolase